MAGAVARPGRRPLPGHRARMGGTVGSSVIIQKEQGEFVNASGFNAWKGFDERGYEIRFFDWEQMASDVAPVEPETMTVGSVQFVRRALRRLGVERPPLDYPPRLI